MKDLGSCPFPARCSAVFSGFPDWTYASWRVVDFALTEAAVERFLYFLLSWPEGLAVSYGINDTFGLRVVAMVRHCSAATDDTRTCRELSGSLRA